MPQLPTKNKFVFYFVKGKKLLKKNRKPTEKDNFETLVFKRYFEKDIKLVFFCSNLEHRVKRKKQNFLPMNLAIKKKKKLFSL